MLVGVVKQQSSIRSRDESRNKIMIGLCAVICVRERARRLSEHCSTPVIIRLVLVKYVAQHRQSTLKIAR